MTKSQGAGSTSLTIPYYVAGDLVIAGPSTPVLTLQANPPARLEFRFESGAGLQVGSATEPGKLFVIAGTTFTGAMPTPGSWKGILLEQQGYGELENAVVEYGGQATGANLTVTTTTGVRKSTIRHSAGCGIRRVGAMGSMLDYLDPQNENIFTSNAGGSQCGP